MSEQFCPTCQRPRMAICPYCHTAGTNFPSAWPESRQPDEQGDHQPQLICPTCDEPLAPSYLRCCEWCGHDFGQGVAGLPPASHEALDGRIIAAMMALAALLLAIVAYFALLLR